MEPHMNVMAWPNVKKKCSSGWKNVFLSVVFILLSYCREKEGKAQSRVLKRHL